MTLSRQPARVRQTRVVTAVHPDDTAARAWARAVGRYGANVFLRDRGRDVSYAEFDEWGRAIAGRLRAHGVGRSTHVALVLDSTAAHLAILVALSQLGAVSVPLDPSHPDDDLRELIHRSGSTWVITDPARDRGFADRPGVRVLDAATLAAARRSDDTLAGPEDLDPGAPWAILYTSGSTSRPRGVVVPQRAFDVTGRALAEAHGYTERDTVLCVLPLHHASATLMSWAPAAAVGASLVLVDRFSRSRFWGLVRNTQATVTIVVPTIAEMLLTVPPADDDREHPLRLLVTHYDVPAFRERFGTEVRTLWGMTETSGLGLTTRAGEAAWAASVVGRPYPPDARVRLVDPDGRDVPCGEVGELWFAHPAVMTGYYGESPPSDGWIRSGDLMREHPDGSHCYVGRSKAVIKRGGENISAHEVERVIADHPAVREVVVVSVPDPVFVEEACAVVVWQEAWRDDAARVAALREFCGERLAAWKMPRYVAGWAGELPKLSNHKVDRRRVTAGLDVASADDRGPRTAPKRPFDAGGRRCQR